MDQLMERYVDGDLSAFDGLYALAAPRVYRMLLQLAPSRADADDLLQVTFVKLHNARSGWVRGGRVLPYLLAIARNAARDSRRSFAAKKILLTAQRRAARDRRPRAGAALARGALRRPPVGDA
jgi:DNA-directed RNA polymerase specialized sigma24 family protein